MFVEAKNTHFVQAVQGLCKGTRLPLHIEKAASNDTIDFACAGVVLTPAHDPASFNLNNQAAYIQILKKYTQKE